MRNNFVRGILFSCVLFSAVYPGFADETALIWKEIKGGHFIVLYESEEDPSFAKETLSRAEEYYVTIANQVGYARYQNYWTWDNRVRIFLYSDQKSFLEKTQQPEWSKGFVPRDAHLFKNKFIITYKQEEDFIDGVLPHEICHLILRDFLAKASAIPVWFDEGMAQLQEKGKKELADRVIRSIVKSDRFIPFSALFNKTIDRNNDPLEISIFYTESISVLDFLIQKYGSNDFIGFCLRLREGKPIEEALISVYNNSFKSIDELQTKWLNYMEN